ncbi:MAG: hypothetical protein M9894_05505 [Planctomycetes bacterium]|nr:hypothetical protein [Planctomycetota bacterium]
MSDGLVVRRGRILCFRLLDIGDEVLLDAAERTMARAEDAKRLKLSRAASMALVFKSPPLDVSLGTRQLPLLPDGGAADVAVSARVFDHGNVSFRFELAIAPGTPLGDLVPLCDELYESELLSEEARRDAVALVARLGTNVVRPHTWADVETYTVIFVEELDGRPTAKEVLAQDVLPKLLLGERSVRPISDGVRGEMLRHAYSYLDDDLVLIDWDSAFVLEPSGSRDVPDVLELGCGQLQGMRYYDQLMDTELGHIYDDVERANRAGTIQLLWSPYDRVARAVHERWLDMTEVTERIEASIKIVGDFYLARVYRGALERFRVPEWQRAVYRKQQLVAQVYALLKGQIDTRRAMLLELTIVLLIALDIVIVLATKASS